MRPSAPLLERLRERIDPKRHKLTRIAAHLGLKTPSLRRKLAGDEPFTLDEAVLMLEALGEDAASLASSPAPVDAPPALSNQPRALLQIGFDAGIDFQFVVVADLLDGWGGPEHIRKQFAGREMMLQLDAAYHRMMAPRMHDDGVQLKLGFDALYDCFIPWMAIRRVIFVPIPPEGDLLAPPPKSPEPPPTPAPPPKGGGRPTLRLVK
jgi:hypothetical protein